MALASPQARAQAAPAGAQELPLTEVDPEIADLLERELDRQRHSLEMIASENFVSAAMLECQGSVLSNKYAVGYPAHREYCGCDQIDVVERLAIERARGLFGADHANVQPYSGALANTAAYHALLAPGDTIIGLDVAHGGHLTHATPAHVSGRLYRRAAYHVDRQAGLIDMDEVRRLAHERRPRLILAGWSAYPRTLDFKQFRAIADEVGAYLMVDMAHFAGLVAAGLYPNPVPYADVVTSTTHKTIGGPRGGLILCTKALATKIDSAVYPGEQGGPLQHVNAAKAVALRVAGSPEFRERQQRTVAGARAIADQLLSAGHDVLTGGTDVHLVMCDLRNSPLDGREAERRLASIGINVSRHQVPFDPRPTETPSGIRVGTPALATRGLRLDDFTEAGSIIAQALRPNGFERSRSALAARVAQIVERYPLYGQIGSPPLP